MPQRRETHQLLEKPLQLPQAHTQFESNFSFFNKLILYHKTLDDSIRLIWNHIHPDLIDNLASLIAETRLFP